MIGPPSEKPVCERLNGWDAQTFTGWHLYDTDFSYRAHLAGLRCGIVSDLHLLHYSHFEKRGVEQSRDFRVPAKAFFEKHKATLPPVPPKWLAWAPGRVKVDTREEALEVMRAISAAVESRT